MLRRREVTSQSPVVSWICSVVGARLPPRAFLGVVLDGGGAVPTWLLRRARHRQVWGKASPQLSGGSARTSEGFSPIRESDRAETPKSRPPVSDTFSSGWRR